MTSMLGGSLVTLLVAIVAASVFTCPVLPHPPSSSDVVFCLLTACVYGVVKLCIEWLKHGGLVDLHTRACRFTTACSIISVLWPLYGTPGLVIASILAWALPSACLLCPLRRRRLRLRPAASVPSFQDRLASLKAWRRQHPDTWPKRGSANMHEAQLARFINNKRGKNKALKLPAHEANALDAVPGWEWDVYEGSWLDWYEELRGWLFSPPNSEMQPCKFYPSSTPPAIQTGDSRAHEIQLGNWVEKQRQLELQGKLNPDRKDKLQKLPGWMWSQRVRGGQQGAERSWQQFSEALSRWPTHQLNPKHDAIPRNWWGRDPHERMLGDWFGKQLSRLRVALTRRRLRTKTKPKSVGASMPRPHLDKLVGYLLQHDVSDLARTAATAAALDYLPQHGATHATEAIATSSSTTSSPGAPALGQASSSAGHVHHHPRHLKLRRPGACGPRARASIWTRAGSADLFWLARPCVQRNVSVV